MTRAAATSPAPPHPWVGHAWITPSGAVVAEAAAGVDPVAVFRHAARLRQAVFFDSAAVDRPTAPPPAGAAATCTLNSGQILRHKCNFRLPNGGLCGAGHPRVGNH